MVRGGKSLKAILKMIKVFYLSYRWRFKIYLKISIERRKEHE